MIMLDTLILKVFMNLLGSYNGSSLFGGNTTSNEEYFKVCPLLILLNTPIAAVLPRNRLDLIQLGNYKDDFKVP